MKNVYAQRATLRRLEKTWSRFEIAINRLTKSDYNPFYHLGTLGIYLLVILTITGIYLTIFYRPGAHVAYDTVEKISATWLGSLMRSVHRYASDAFLLVSIIHALKTFLSDRFWGARWLAWVSGWIILILSWVIGTMGYWLIWDVRSQWLTEILINNTGSGIALTFLNPNMAASSFAAFVIVLFLHIFLPILFLFLITIHLLRLTRARIWSPRWIMILSGLALVIISIIKPTVSEAPANLNTLIENVRLDAWYLGFLPVLESLGDANFWLLTTFIFGISIFLPWITKGKSNGPAVIHEAECNGCGLCASECPYRAIEMHYRDDDTSRFKSIAVINADLCTGCGLCVGTCATLGIELLGLPTEDVYNNGLLEAVKKKIQSKTAPTVIFTCQRHASLGSLPDSLNLEQWNHGKTTTNSPVYSGQWQHNDIKQETISCVLPCLGMTDVDWVKEINKLGAHEILLLGCPTDDCNYREGVQWESARLRRRKSILAPNIQWAEAAPGDSKVIPGMLAAASKPVEEKKKPNIPNPNTRAKQFPGPSTAGFVILIFSLLVALALPVDFLSQMSLAGESQIRAIVEHSGIIGTSLEADNMVLPEDATVELSQILGGTRYPVEIKILVDSMIVLEETFQPSGIRSEGEINGMALYTLHPGTYELEIQISDDGSGFRTVYASPVRLEQSQIFTLIFNQQLDTFEQNTSKK